jgi:hypothetical protein
MVRKYFKISIDGMTGFSTHSKADIEDFLAVEKDLKKRAAKRLKEIGQSWTRNERGDD